LNAIAAHHGYVAVGGPTKGQGNAAELMVAIAGGEVALVLLNDNQRRRAMQHLEAEAERLREGNYFLSIALQEIADSLREAWPRQERVDAEELAEYEP
jgi:hypothetical protein